MLDEGHLSLISLHTNKIPDGGESCHPVLHSGDAALFMVRV